MEALQRHFQGVERVRGAAEALILLQDAESARSVALVMVELHRPELTGPEFVREVVRRAPEAEILVLGQRGESAADYPGRHVHFLPRNASIGEMLAGVRGALAGRWHRAA